MEQPTATANRHERRVRVRHAVNASAAIFLVHSGLKLSGRVLDLSMSGCRIRCDDPFMLGIYTRVEAEFRLEGFPLRLGGVIQSVHDLRTMGIRFLDVSARKRDQLEQLIGELEEVEQMEAAGCWIEPSGPGASDPESRA